MTDALIEARRAWAGRLIRRCRTHPPYGSREWLGLPEGSPEKIASVVAAAECWALDGDDLEARLQLEVETESRAFKATEDEAYRARRDAHRRDWRPGSPGFAPSPGIADDVEREHQHWLDEQEGADDDGH
jgi:hypothetical protein